MLTHPRSPPHTEAVLEPLLGQPVCGYKADLEEQEDEQEQEEQEQEQGLRKQNVAVNATFSTKSGCENA